MTKTAKKNIKDALGAVICGLIIGFIFVIGG